MDELDKKLFNDLSEKVEIPARCEYVIKNAFINDNKENDKHFLVHLNVIKEFINIKCRRLAIALTTLALILVPVSITAVSTIIEKIKVVPDVPEAILQNVPDEAYIRVSNDIPQQESAVDPEFEEKLRKAEEKNNEENERLEQIIRKFRADEYDALKTEIAQNEYSGENGYYSEDDIEIKGDKLVLDILENEELTEEESNLLKDFMKSQASKIKNMPDFVARIEKACQ